VDIWDPWANSAEVSHEYGYLLTEPNGPYDSIVLAVAHKQFQNFNFLKIKKANTIIFDVKGMLPLSLVDGRL
jgi:UDP-N-acetyl-D-galactosamine dehydrogenase